MGLRFTQNNEEVVLEYRPSWRFEHVLEKLGLSAIDEYGGTAPADAEDIAASSSDDGVHELTVSHVFHFTPEDLIDCDTGAEKLVFRFATADPSYGDDYYAVQGRILGIRQTVLLDKAVDISRKLFAAGFENRTSVMSAISRLLDPTVEVIAIGGTRDDAIPSEEYDLLLREFPTTRLLQHYGEAQIEGYIASYLHMAKDYATEYDRARKRRRKGLPEEYTLRSSSLDQSRLQTVATSYEMMKAMLVSGQAVAEEAWQKQVLEVLTTLYPQYVAVIPKAEMRDAVSGKARQADFLLVDSSGNVDVLEIKKAFQKHKLIMKSTYRENHIPARELSGGISQIEKYIYHLLNWGQTGERALTERYRDLLPEGMRLRFLNPRGLLLIGDCSFTEDEQRDFDLICRQYAHIADIVTYNDMLTRLERMLWHLTDSAE